MKLTPIVNFINIYARVFCTKFWSQSQNVTRKAAKKDVGTKKSLQKTLIKLTPAAELYAVKRRVKPNEMRKTFLRIENFSSFSFAKAL